MPTSGYGVRKADGQKCVNCGSDADDGARYCDQCGKPLPGVALGGL
jgi:hypothetical protein